MIVRFGYVATALNLENCSPSKTATVTNINKLADMDTKISKLKRLSRENLSNTLRILRYNVAHDILVYRLTSKLVPLATHPDFQNWDYIADLQDLLAEMGDYIRTHNLRVSAHPDHFTLINSPKQKIFADSLRDLAYHDAIFSAMGLPDATLVMHVGGLYHDAEASIARFKQNFALLPEAIRNRVALENDDKSYSINQVLPLCQELGVPMVLDVHHHSCCNHGEDLLQNLSAIYDTWRGQLPKVHFSSPKNEKQFRHHADDVSVTEFTVFLCLAKEIDRDIDVMIEAKNKDRALFKLMEGLREIKGVKPLNQAAIEF